MKTFAFQKWMVLLAVAITGATQVFASEVDDLLRQLGSEDQKAQSAARQLLPRHGLAPVQGLLVMLEHPNASVWWSARNVLSDIANEAGAPGRETDRKALTATLLDAVAAGENATVRREVLKLLPVVVRPGDDLSALTPLLLDFGWAEFVRAALFEINTPEAHAALVAGLSTNDAVFKVAILNGLAGLRYDGAMDAILAARSHVDKAVQRAATRVALSSGDIAYRDFVDEVLGWEGDDPKAGELVLDYGDRLYAKGGQWNAAMAVYKQLRTKSTNPVLQGAALARLGQRGDESAVPLLLEALQSNDALIKPGVAGLLALQGPIRKDALSEAFAVLPEKARIMLYAPMAEEGGDEFLSLLRDEAQAGTANSDIALDALTGAGSPAVVDLVVARIQAGDADSAAAWRTRLQQFALQSEQRGDTTAAGEAWLAVYQHSEAQADRLAALEGIKRHPAPDAFRIVFDNSSEEALRSLPPELLVSVAFQTGEEAPEHQKAMELLLGRLNEGAAVQALASAANAAGKGAWGAAMIGTIMKWQVVGPFPWTNKEDFGPDPLDPRNVDTSQPVDGVAWQQLEAGGAEGMINLMGAIGGDSLSAYAVAVIEVAEATDAQLKAGSDDALKAWVNGEVVHEHLVDRGFALDSDTAPIHLNAGKNVLLLKIGQNAGGWAFGARLTDSDGFPLKFTY